jgi:hypothetical protein
VLRYDENPDRTIRGELDRYNLFGTMSHDLGGVEFFSEVGYYHAVLNGQREQSAPLSSAPISIPATNFYNPFGPTTLNGAPNPNRLPNLINVPAGGLPLTIVNYRPVDTGPRTFTVTDDLVACSAAFAAPLASSTGNLLWDIPGHARTTIRMTRSATRSSSRRSRNRLPMPTIPSTAALSLIIP